MKVLITGGGGLLGTAGRKIAADRGWTVEALSRRELDVTDRDAVWAAVAASAPDLLLHCAAYTAVDRAETDQELAMRVNGEGARLVAEAAAAAGALMIYPSTDYVFDGAGERPYRPSDPPHPTGAYAVSKLAGERGVQSAGGRWMIARTAWLYGAGGPDFVDAILRVARRAIDTPRETPPRAPGDTSREASTGAPIAPRPSIQVVMDQVGSPTWADSLATGLLDLGAAGVTGTYHLTDAGWTDRAEWARRILALAGLDCEVEGVTTASRHEAAARPLDSRLDCSETVAALGRPLPGWSECLERYMRSVT